MKLSELKKLAEAALEKPGVIVPTLWMPCTEEAHAYIASANPQQVLKLIETIEKLRAGLEYFRDHHDWLDPKNDYKGAMAKARDLLKETEQV